MSPDDRLLTVGTVARELQVSDGTVRRWIKTGFIQATQTDDGYRIRPEAIVGLENPPRYEHRTCGVYFVACGEFVKIGFTKDLQARLASLATSNPHELTLLHIARCPDGKSAATLETELHTRFASCHHRREWFRRTVELDAYISTLQVSSR